MFPARRSYTIRLPTRALSLGERCLVMGILNVTPDSFAEASPTLDPAAAIDRALRMQEEGADIIDVGGESTRPGTEPIGGTEELARVLPVVKALAKRLRVPLSVDTYREEVARAVVGEGASIINDISGLRYEPALADVVAASGVALVLMHMRGRSKAMYAEAVYRDVVADVTAELEASLAVAAARGVGAAIHDCRPGAWVCQTAERQLWCAGTASGAGSRARSTSARRSVAQVLHARSVGRSSRTGARLGHGSGRDRCGVGGRPYRPGTRGRRDGAGRERGGGDTTSRASALTRIT